MEAKRVLIVDDSALMRKLLTEALSNVKGIEVVGTAPDAYIAADKIKRLQPDVLTLDIEMPRMDGLTFLSRLMTASPLPVLMVSALTDSGARETMKALELGAVDFILKPKPDESDKWDSFRRDLADKILAMDSEKVKKRMRSVQATPPQVDKKYSADVILPKQKPHPSMKRTETIIAIGASTGGTEVIAEILSVLKEDTPGIVIAQHMPEKFTEAFANRVNGISRMYVKEGAPGDRLYRGMALIAPGNRHMLLHRDSSGYWVEINDGMPVNRHRPSVDVLFRSVAQSAGMNAVGVILTGMGADGANGLLEMRQAGAVTLAQDEESCIVFGMPNEAIKRGAAEMVRNIRGITEYLNAAVCVPGSVQ
ncbi:MAG: chemotaxis response regulator protein-glutamate methylesterase [Spirochaetes bacterium]|nr:chemotaxis response regulator protein-glutamate methylesterase [Spirochaetota bacterium]